MIRSRTSHCHQQRLRTESTVHWSDESTRGRTLSTGEVKTRDEELSLVRVFDFGLVQTTLTKWEKGTNYYGSETPSAASLATFAVVAFFALFERDDHFHAHLWTSGNRSSLWHRVRPGRSYYKCHGRRYRQSNQTVTYS